MGKRSVNTNPIEKNEELLEENTDFQLKKEEKLLNLLAEIIIKSALKEFYETCDKVS